MTHHDGLRRPVRRKVLQGGLAGLVAASGLCSARAATHLSYWNHFTSQTEQKGLRQVEARFLVRHAGAAIAAETIPNSEYMTKLTAAVITNSLPHTAMMTGDRFPDAHSLKTLADITPEIARWPHVNDFAPSTWRSIERDGRRFGVPAFSFVNWMYYRKDYFEEAGLAVPDTLEEFLEACIKLTDRSKNRYGFGLRGGGGGHYLLLDMLLAYGSPVVADGKPAIAKPGAVEALRFYSELYTRYQVAPPSAPNDSYRQIMEGFRTGQTAMLWHHTGSLTELTPHLNRHQLGTAIRPKGPALRAARVDYVYNSICSGRERKAAWDWISFWAEVEPAIAFLEETGYFPASKEVAKDPRITENPLYHAAIHTLEFGQPAIGIVGVEAWAANTMWPEFQKVLVGVARVEDAVDAMMRSLDRALK